MVDKKDMSLKGKQLEAIAILSGNSGMQAVSLLSGQYSLLFTAPEAVIDRSKWQENILVLGREVTVAVQSVIQKCLCTRFN